MLIKVLMMDDKISLIIPAKNEMESLEAVLSEINNNQFVGEKIVVVDSEKDNSIDVARKFNCRIIIQKDSGYGSAIIEGFKEAKFKFGCIFNADYSFNPVYFEEMIKFSKNYNFIFGTRYSQNSGSDDDDIITYIGNKIFSFICKFFLRINLTDILYTFVLCNVESFNKLSLEKKDFRLCIELPSKVRFKNFSYCEVPMYERKRFAGKKNVNVIKDGFLILIEIIASFKYFFNKN
tara:strand:+ start:113 stop:817 length:705 start_codon:yes stop_codon:yes gene_type:complete